MLQHEFEDGLRVVTSFNMVDLEAAGVIQQGDTGAWVDFTRNPYRWVSHLPPTRSEKMWALIEANLPARSISDESADAMLDICQLATEFGWRGDSSMWRWLRARLDAYARHDRRVIELLEANNDYLQQARDARAVVRSLRGEQSGIYVASKVRHAATWRMLRAEGLPIKSTWIDEAGEGESGDLADLWRRCILEASTAEVLLLYRLDDEILKGAWVELGAALAIGVSVYAVGIEKFTVANDRRITHFPNLDAALEATRSLLAVAA